MSKRVFLVHGWDGSPENGWFPWLKRELSARGFAVCAPQLPEPEEPQIGKWIPALKEHVGLVDSETYFVGHSMGCQAIARFLTEMTHTQPAGGAVFVAGFFTELTLNTDDDRTRRVVKEWLKTPLDLLLVKSRLTSSIAIFSDDDPFVPLTNAKAFEAALGSRVIIECGQGHFSGSIGTYELPVALRTLLELSAATESSTDA